MTIHSNTTAAIWMAGWFGLMLTMAVAGRETLDRLDIFQVMELRALIGILMLFPLVMYSGGRAAITTERLGHHFWRNLVHYLAQYSWFLALSLIPLAQVVSIEFTMAIWTAILATIFLNERMGVRRWIAVVVCLVGVLVIVRPEASGINVGQLAALFAALGFGVSTVLIKSLTKTESVVRIIFWMLIIQGAIGLIPAVFFWQPVSPELWGWLAVIAFCGTFSHFCMTKALTYAEATVVVPMDFLRVPLAALTGLALYGEQVDILVILGAALILVGNFLNLHKRRQAKTA